jgi:hypothetical protein
MADFQAKTAAYLMCSEKIMLDLLVFWLLLSWLLVVDRESFY